jgi:hypothetical protein
VLRRILILVQATYNEARRADPAPWNFIIYKGTHRPL